MSSDKSQQRNQYYLAFNTNECDKSLNLLEKITVENIKINIEKKVKRRRNKQIKKKLFKKLLQLVKNIVTEVKHLDLQEPFIKHLVNNSLNN